MKRHDEVQMLGVVILAALCALMLLGFFAIARLFLALIVAAA
jgi:hypothetical protein